MWQSIGLTLLVIVATLACVLLFMLCDTTTGIPFLLTVMTFICVTTIIHLAVAIQFGVCRSFPGAQMLLLDEDKLYQVELVFIGWYVVWQLFLSKFKFLRELIGDTGSQQGDNEPAETEAEQETPPSPQRSRQKSARQRRAPAEDTT